MGPKGKERPPIVFIPNSFEDLALVDVKPIMLTPTWTNKSTGKEFIGKTLDKFLMKGTPLSMVGKYRSAIVSYGGLD
jgi:hypothetical protein